MTNAEIEDTRWSNISTVPKISIEDPNNSTNAKCHRPEIPNQRHFYMESFQNCLFSARYCWGVFPVTFRKVSEKWLEEAK